MVNSIGEKTANRKPGGLYIHIPFCVKKCNYCAFLSAPADEITRGRYVEALIKEIVLRGSEDKESHTRREIYDTVYFGGGTPSVLAPEQIQRILDAVRRSFCVSDDAEITLEANPGTLCRDGYTDAETEVLSTLRAYREAGINRLSMGVQSMNDERLGFLGRIHDSETVRRDFRLAREAGFDNINLDIIFSVPGESTEDALEDIREIAALGPEHISFYSLQLEEGTPLFRMWENREFEEISDDDDRKTYHRGCRLLENLGYTHYEISNFARPGRESRHNSKYWNMSDYAGLGLGASGFMTVQKTSGTEQRVRYKNVPDLGHYIEMTESGRIPVGEEHINTLHDNISEAVFTGLRRMDGIRFRDIPADAFREYYAEALEDAEGFVRSGHLIIDDEGMRLTESGIDISNRIMALFV